jgi:hypothetical protein
VLGGSTGFNYYRVRGRVATFNDWEEYGGTTWNWENTNKYFNKSVIYHDDDNLFLDALRKISNQGGPMHIRHSDVVSEFVTNATSFTKKQSELLIRNAGRYVISNRVDRFPRHAREGVGQQGPGGNC